MTEQKNFTQSVEYKKWVLALKAKVGQAQLKAAVTVNQQLLIFYWNLGIDIVEKQKNTAWGEGFLKQLSRDLMEEFPNIKGFSERNLKYIRQWVLFWTGQAAIGQQPVAQLTQIPWGHNLIIIAKCKDTTESLYYADNTLQHGWSRSVLTHQVEYALSDIHKPIGVSEYQITKSLPKEFKSSLPSIEQIEAELSDDLDGTADGNARLLFEKNINAK